MSRSGGKSRPDVVMIHGGFCGPWVWDGFHAKFTAVGYKVSRPTLRFHDGGKPPAALGTTSLGDYAADLSAEIGTRAPVLIGHSLGGLLAQMLASRHDVKACVLLAPSAPWGVPPSTLFEIAAAQAMLLNVGFWTKVLEPKPDVAGEHFLGRFASAEREALFRRLVPESGRATFEVMHWGLDMSRASDVEACKVTCPLLILAGGDDRINPPGTVERIAALYKNTEYEKISGMGHWLVGEPGWEKLCDRALAWLENI